MADAPIQPGDLLATKYRVDKVLGAGAMGVVVRATDLALDRKVAIKMMKVDSALQREKEARFLREARVVARLAASTSSRCSSSGRSARPRSSSWNTSKTGTWPRCSKSVGPSPSRRR
jgi:serine/threonine-protein kinase